MTKQRIVRMGAAFVVLLALSGCAKQPEGSGGDKGDRGMERGSSVPRQSPA